MVISALSYPLSDEFSSNLMQSNSLALHHARRVSVSIISTSVESTKSVVGITGDPIFLTHPNGPCQMVNKYDERLHDVVSFFCKVTYCNCSSVNMK